MPCCSRSFLRPRRSASASTASGRKPTSRHGTSRTPNREMGLSSFSRLGHQQLGARDVRSAVTLQRMTNLPVPRLTLCSLSQAAPVTQPSSGLPRPGASADFIVRAHPLILIGATGLQSGSVSLIVSKTPMTHFMRSPSITEIFDGNFVGDSPNPALHRRATGFAPFCSGESSRPSLSVSFIR